MVTFLSATVYREKLLKMTSLTPYFKAIEIGSGSFSAGVHKGAVLTLAASNPPVPLLCLESVRRNCNSVHACS